MQNASPKSRVVTSMVGSAILCSFVATTEYSTAGLADELSSSQVIMGEVLLDFDGDGKADRAVLVQDGSSASVDLYIYFGADGDTLAVSRRPTIVKKDIASGAALAIESGRNGGLTIRYGCGGCSNDTATELKLAYRGGEVVIGGYTWDWDTRSGMGRCDVNFFTRKGFVQHGMAGGRAPIKVRSGPVALSAWSHEVIAKICP